MTTLAMDQRVVRRWQDLQTAQTDVRPLVGDLPAMDSAAATYHFAIQQMRPDLAADLPVSACNRAVWQHFVRTSRGSSPRVAMDGADTKRIAEQFPDWNRLRL